MSLPDSALGGRIPILLPEEMSHDQKQVYERINGSQVPWANSSGFEAKAGNGGLIGPYNSQLLSPRIDIGYLAMLEAEKSNTSLSERVREVVILSVGAVWKSDYEIYAHSAVGHRVGLSGPAIQTLAAGGEPDDLSEQEKVAHRFARQLSLDRRVDANVYAATEQSFGRTGLADILYLIGIYHIVCGFLNAFEVPAPVEQSANPATAPVVPLRTGHTMAQGHSPPAKLAVVATFPSGYFLENLVMRENQSLLVTVLNHGELWYLPPVTGAAPVEPALLFRFPDNGRGENALGIIEFEPDVFLIATSNFYTTHECYLYRLDLRGWSPGTDVEPELVLVFPKAARGLNGMCLLAPTVLVVADCFASLIWRIDLDTRGMPVTVREWLTHESMGYFPGTQKPEQPGVNGVRFATRTHALYYTSTAKKLLMRVPVDPVTYEAAGTPELIVAGRMGDDFCIDEEGEVIYLATHRQNTIDRVSMSPAGNTGFTQSVVGDPFDEDLIGPSGGVWGRGAGEYGSVAYFVTDGGTASPPADGVVRPARVVRLDLG